MQNNNLNKLILLGPAGTVEMGKEVISAGADEIFAGLKGFSRRGPEYELTIEEIIELHNYAVDQGKNLRLAINCYPQLNYEEKILEKIEYLVNMGLSKIILNDPGLCSKVKSLFPHIQIYISVGASIYNYLDALFWQNIGADGIVLLCNLIPEQIREISKRTSLELEILVHANKDFTFLGKCWISSYCSVRNEDYASFTKISGSPNRGGICYRVCKSCWNLADDKSLTTDFKNEYRTIFEEISAFYSAGVTCFKIQGREYSIELIKKMVSNYRKVIDCLIEKQSIPEFCSNSFKVIENIRDVERITKTAKLIEIAKE